jgi:hypothetical protein
MMGLPAHTVRIGSHEYEFNLLPVEVGHPLRWELIGLLGEPLLQALAGAAEGKGLGDMEVDKVLAGLSGVFRRLDPKFVMRLQQTFVSVTRYRGLGGEWTDLGRTWVVHFAGKYHELDQLTFEHLKANYLSFLDDSAGWQALVRAGQRALSGATSPSTSHATGMSGASSVASGTA